MRSDLRDLLRRRSTARTGSPVSAFGVKALFVLMLAGIAPITSAAAKDAGEISAWVTGDNGSGGPLEKPQNDFGCTDTVFAIIEATDAPQAKHQILVRWIDPAGKERERTRSQLRGHDGTARIWSWLRLHRGAGGTLLSMFDASAGFENFIGTWTVSVAVDGQPYQDVQFEVLC